jgi:hypothetical protein
MHRWAFRGWRRDDLVGRSYRRGSGPRVEIPRAQVPLKLPASRLLPAPRQRGRMRRVVDHRTGGLDRWPRF